MKLYGSPTSPFVRKVRVLLLEKGLKEADVEFVTTNPWEDPSDLIAVNPLSRVPVMQLKSGIAFSDSRLISNYIESNLPGPKMVPEAGAAKWFVLQAEALSDGMIDVCIRIFLEKNRPAEKQMLEKVERDEQTVRRAIEMMAKMVKGFEEPVNLGSLSIACALAYADFRLPQVKWREKHPDLSGWYQTMRLRPSMKATQPPS